jgi:hypothetical protein
MLNKIKTFVRIRDFLPNENSSYNTTNVKNENTLSYKINSNEEITYTLV